MTASPTTAPQFEAVELTLTRGGKQIWNNASWNIEGYTAVVGANGAGKSSTLTMLAGQLSPDAGELHCRVNGAGLTPDNWMTHVTLAAPWVSLPTHMNLDQIKAFHSAFRTPRNGELGWDSLIESSGLHVHSEAPLHAWSSGQKQRLHLSLALGTESPVVLLDEPASNLDATGIRWFHEVIADVAAASTLIVATNDRNKEAPGQPALLEI